MPELGGFVHVKPGGNPRPLMFQRIVLVEVTATLVSLDHRSTWSVGHAKSGSRCIASAGGFSTTTYNERKK